MTKQEIKTRIEKLKKEINHHRYLYHVLDTQEISDSALDSLKHELAKLESDYPEFITPDSPTQRIGGKPLDKFQKVEHSSPMLSLEDAFSFEEMSKWEEKIAKLIPKSQLDYFVEMKIDGFAIALVYEKGIFMEGSTRGNGTIGENVTQNLKTIEAIPLKIEVMEKEAEKVELDPEVVQSLRKLVKKGTVEIRGEVYMTLKSFEKANKERKKRGEPPYANPRNIAAGSIRQLNSKVAASRKLNFLAYSFVADVGQKTHAQDHELCRLLGFKTDPFARYCETLSEVTDFWKEINGKRKKLPHQIDGTVVTVNNNDVFRDLGVVGKAPRGAIAFKYPGEEVVSVVKNIFVQVGRTGVLTPVADLEPVNVGGVTVSRATLHNEDEIKRLKVKIGDTVIVQRAGDVIPDILRVLADLRTGKEKEFYFPKKCPSCGAKIIRPAGEAAYRCLNSEDCPAQQKERLYHFVSKYAFDIPGLGPKILDQLKDEGVITDAADIFSLTEADLVPLERFAEKSAENLVSAIRGKKEISLSRFIYSLGILHIGEETSRVLASEILKKGAIEKLSDLIKLIKSFPFEDMEAIKDIGPVVARSIYDWFHNKYNIALLKKFDKAGIKIFNESYRSPVIGRKFENKIFVLTGELESITRDEAKEKIRSLGGKVSESVSKKTDFVVVGKNPGSKFEKAKKLGIKILSEKEFIELLG